ncbi:MAG: redoxin domain-containing protein [Ilumatobacter sp.]|uniref:TlpA family protein disulfide reductase n=1 Tax=Ilumatobacter sp. TaxID=1967498 RepID=UPI003C76FD2C
MTCNQEAPSVEAAAQQFGDQVNFVGVAWTGNDDSYQGFVDEHGLTFPQIQDDPGDVFSRFDIAFQPAFVIVKTDGGIETLAGAPDDALLAQIIAESI